MPRYRRWFLPATIFLVCATLTTHGKFSVSGDEPHYLIVAQSLAADGDFDVRNNYANGDSRRFGVDGLAVDLHARDTPGGALHSIHDVGVPIALLPAYVAATTVAGVVPEGWLRRFRMSPGLFAYSLISLVVIAITCTAAVLTRDALVLTGAKPATATAVVLAAWLSPPVLSNSFLVFPEPFALLVTAIALRVSVIPEGERLGRLAVLGFPIALGLLPWFHRKYVPYVATLLLVVAWLQRDRLAAIRASDRVAALAWIIAPSLVLAAWTWYHWGTLSGPLTAARVPFSLAAFKEGSVGLLVDRENGLFVWAPIYLLMPAGWWLAGRRATLWLLPVLMLAALSAAHDLWWGGFSPAGRFLVPLVPLFCIAGVKLLEEPALRRACVVLAVPQALIAAYGWQHPRALWPRGDGSNRVLHGLWLGSIEALLPSVRSAAPAIRIAAIYVAAIGLLNAAAALVVKQRRTGHLNRTRNPK
jgi:hypothetical protein